MSHSRTDPAIGRRDFAVLGAGALGLAAVGMAGAAPASAAGPDPLPVGSPDPQDCFDFAQRIAGDDPVALAIRDALTPGWEPSFDTENQPPTWIFDDAAVISTGFVSSLVLTTSHGYVLVDALDDAEAIDSLLIPGLESLGLDPQEIRHVVITHGHKDHYGGARHLAERFGARIHLSQADWGLIAGEPDAPDRDLVIEDGRGLTVGGRRLEFHLTPGHTPGTTSIILPVSAGGREHMMSIWGGTNPPGALADLEAYHDSAVRFRAVARQAGSDVAFSTHPFCDYGIERMAQLRRTGAQDDPRGGPGNPFVVGGRRTSRYMTVLETMARGCLIRAGGED